eukprot:375230-Pyramimonas_sp.AAC.1
MPKSFRRHPRARLPGEEQMCSATTSGQNGARGHANVRAGSNGPLEEWIGFRIGGSGGEGAKRQ